MTKTANNKKEESNKSEIISLMISHLKGELNPTCEIKMNSLINECSECKRLYKEVIDFFDPSEALLYGIQNQEKVSNTKELIFTLGEIHETTEISKKEVNLNYEEEFEAFNLKEDSECFC